MEGVGRVWSSLELESSLIHLPLLEISLFSDHFTDSLTRMTEKSIDRRRVVVSEFPTAGTRGLRSSTDLLSLSSTLFFYFFLFPKKKSAELVVSRKWHSSNKNKLKHQKLYQLSSLVKSSNSSFSLLFPPSLSVVNPQTIPFEEATLKNTKTNKTNQSQLQLQSQVCLT